MYSRVLAHGECDEEKKETGEEGKTKNGGTEVFVYVILSVARKGLLPQRLEGNRCTKALANSKKAGVAETW